MGKLNAEYTYGGLLISNAFLWILFWIGKGKRRLKEKRIYAFTFVSIVISAILGIIDVTGAGILQRYMVDMIWGVWLAAVLVCFALAEEAKEEGTLRTLFSCMAAVCFLQLIYGFGVVFGNGDLSVNVRASNPGLYFLFKGVDAFFLNKRQKGKSRVWVSFSLQSGQFLLDKTSNYKHLIFIDSAFAEMLL